MVGSVRLRGSALCLLFLANGQSWSHVAAGAGDFDKCRSTLGDFLKRPAGDAEASLMQLCARHYSEAVCNAARHELQASRQQSAAQRTHRSAPADEVCRAVEAATASVRGDTGGQAEVGAPVSLLEALSLRRRAPASIAVFNASGNATGNTTNATATNATSFGDRLLSLEESLVRKWNPLLYGRFAWEWPSTNSSGIDALVANMGTSNGTQPGINASSPGVVQRAATFTSFVTTSTPAPALLGIVRRMVQDQGVHADESGTKAEAAAPSKPAGATSLGSLLRAAALNQHTVVQPSLLTQAPAAVISPESAP